MSTPTATPPDDDRPHAAGPAAPPATALHATDDTPAVPEPEIGNRWGTLPPPERRAELDARLAEWATKPDHGKLLGPFDRDDWDDSLSGADVYYLAVRSIVGPDGDLALGVAHLREFQLLVRPGLHLQHATLIGAHLEHATLIGAHLEHANLVDAQLEHSNLVDAHLEHADLAGAHLEHASLSSTHLEHASLTLAHLEQAHLSAAVLAGVDLRGAFLDAGMDLTDVTVTDAEHGSIRVADVRWQGVNLAVAKEWPADMVLGDEQAAWNRVREPLPKAGTRKERREAIQKRRNVAREAFREAARANRQLAAAMRDQGMNDEADHFAYRAQVM